VACELGHWAQGIWRLQELNWQPVEGSSCLEACVEAGRSFWWGAGGQAEVAQNLADHGGIFNGGEDGQGATALWAGGHVDGENPFE